MRARACLISVIILFLMASAAIADDAIAPVGPIPEYSPKEVHQWLWENELRPRLVEYQEHSSLMAAKSVTNWQEYDMSFYTLDLDIDHVAQVLYGVVGSWGVVEVASLDTVVVDLLSDMTVDSVFDDGGPLTYTHIDGHVTVHLDKIYMQGEAFQFSIAYHGTPGGSGGFLGFDFTSRNTLPLITTLSEPYGARSWWPCNDITIDKVDSVDIIVTVDASLVVSSNGLMESDVDNGDGTHTVFWKERYPITPYLVSLSIHPYAVWYDWYHYGPTDSMLLQFHVYPDHDLYSRPYFGILPEMIGVLADKFGEYPFIDEKYGPTHFNWGGAMEHQTNTSTTSTSFGYSDDIISHELGHQWWGDMVTCGDWHHIWINEGFAVYSEAVYHEGKYGEQYYHDYMNAFEFTSGGSIYIQDTTDIWTIFGNIVYDKGGWVLHMLRHVVGDSLFFQALADYRQQYVWKTATTEQFRDAVEATTGMELDYFFEQWIYGTGRPNYRVSYMSESDPSGGWWNYIHIRQTQASQPQVFTMPIDLYLEMSGDTTVAVVFNDAREQNFMVHTDNQTTHLFLDPERWVSRLISTETYVLHIINEELDGGMQASAYADTVIVRGGYNNYSCVISNGVLPDGLTLTPGAGIISGTPTEVGEFTFTIVATDQVYLSYVDSMTYTLNIAPPAVDRPGDANIDGTVDVGDVVYLINYTFKNGPAPVISNWADANADCSINVGDAVMLINHVFKGGLAPMLGCVD